jgi:hypothetical protein
MTQRPSGSPNAGRINCFPTKTSQQFLSQSILSQPILSQYQGAAIASRFGRPNRDKSNHATNCLPACLPGGVLREGLHVVVGRD